VSILPIHSTLGEFIFWSVLVISIEFSINSAISWFRRRSFKKYLQAQKQGN